MTQLFYKGIITAMYEKTVHHEKFEKTAFEEASAALELILENRESGKEQALLSLARAQEEHDFPALSRSWYAIGTSKVRQGNFHEAISVAELARKDIVAHFGQDRQIPEILNLLGTAYQHLGFSDISITYFLEALRALRKDSNLGEKISLLNNIGLAMNDLGQFGKALEYLRRALALCVGPSPTLAQIHANIGSSLAESGRSEEALSTLDMAIKMAREQESEFVLCDALDMRGKALCALHRPEEAEKAYLEAIEIHAKTGDTMFVADTHMHLGELRMFLGRTEEAVEIFARLLDVEPERQSFLLRGRLFTLQAQALESLGRWEEASASRRAYMQLEVQGALSRGREKFLDNRVSEEQEKILALEIRLRQRAESVMRIQRSFIETLASITELRDIGTGSHIRRSSHYVGLLARELLSTGKINITDEQLDGYITLACLHDIGKVSVSDAILNKPGSLSAEERTLMSSHVHAGENLIEHMGWENINDLYATLAKEIIGSHHERWDGSGYLRGLKGNEIPLGGRLMAVADVYDALRAKRPYKEALSHDEAHDFILRNSGTHFDPMVVEAFDRLEARFAEVFSSES